MDHGTITREFDAGTAGVRSGAQDVFPMFFREAVRNEMKSLDAGRPIFDTVEMIKIIIPGDNHTSPVRLVKESDKERYADAYSRFKNEEEIAYDGTPVDSWNRLDMKQVFALKAIGFFTIESIANCSDANLGKLGMGGMMLRDMAKAFIESAKSGGIPERLVAENAQLRDQMKNHSQTIDDLKQLVEKMAKDKGVDISKINIGLNNAMSSAREVTKSQAGDLPDGWRDLKTKDAIEMCKALDFTITPRNKDEAMQLLGEYQGTRDALKK